MLKLMTIIIQTELITLRFLSHEPLAIQISLGIEGGFPAVVLLLLDW
jgi:hypothetical protein